MYKDFLAYPVDMHGSVSLNFSQPEVYKNRDCCRDITYRKNNPFTSTLRKAYAVKRRKRNAEDRSLESRFSLILEGLWLKRLITRVLAWSGLFPM